MYALKDLHPTHTRNFGSNIQVSQFIKQKPGVYRSTRKISSHFQVLHGLWRDTEDTGVPPLPLNTTITLLPSISLTTTDPPCRTITHSNVHGPQTDSSRLWCGRIQV